VGRFFRSSKFSEAALEPMKLLLDTHALLWLAMAPERLGESAVRVVTAPGAEVYASHVSLWEMAIKRRQGKLQELDSTALEWFESVVRKSKLIGLPIAAKHLGFLEFLPRLHADPFDRLLVAQARAEQLVIVSQDPLITAYNVDTIWL
jgi:PIN domain nuclease of toxin-antitoxin system